jgi:hypothetical protein
MSMDVRSILANPDLMKLRTATGRGRLFRETSDPVRPSIMMEWRIGHLGFPGKFKKLGVPVALT